MTYGGSALTEHAKLTGETQLGAARDSKQSVCSFFNCMTCLCGGDIVPSFGPLQMCTYSECDDTHRTLKKMKLVYKRDTSSASSCKACLKCHGRSTSDWSCTLDADGLQMSAAKVASANHGATPYATAASLLLYWRAGVKLSLSMNSKQNQCHVLARLIVCLNAADLSKQLLRCT